MEWMVRTQGQLYFSPWKPSTYFTSCLFSFQVFAELSGDWHHPTHPNTFTPHPSALPSHLSVVFLSEVHYKLFDLYFFVVSFVSLHQNSGSTCIRLKRRGKKRILLVLGFEGIKRLSDFQLINLAAYYSINILLVRKLWLCWNRWLGGEETVTEEQKKVN